MTSALRGPHAAPIECDSQDLHALRGTLLCDGPGAPEDPELDPSILLFFPFARVLICVTDNYVLLN